MHAPAYENLVSTVLNEEDRTKFETFIGRVISQGPNGTLVVQGGYGSGKSTLLHLARGIIKTVNDVVYCHDFDRLRYFGDDHRYLFIASNNPMFPDSTAVINTTGKTVSHQEYELAMTRTVQVDFNEISRHCIEQYNNSQEK